MEKEDIKKIEYLFPLEKNIAPIKKAKNCINESNFWLYLDYTKWIPGEIEIEEEIKKDYM
jgi:hypothetical protein